MKKLLLTASLLISVLGFSQVKKKQVYKKKPVYKTAVKKAPVKKPIDTIKIAESTQTTTIETKPEIVAEEAKQDFESTANKILKKSGWIKNRNSFYVRGIEGFVKGVYSGNGKIYVLLEIANRTNIPYDIESAVFITAPISKGRKTIEVEEKVFQPIWSNQPETFAKKTTKKLVYVFDKFTISDNKNLLFVLNETEGERTLTLEIKPNYIINSEYIN